MDGWIVGRDASLNVLRDCLPVASQSLFNDTNRAIAEKEVGFSEIAGREWQISHINV